MSGTYKNDAEEASGAIAAHAETLANLATRWLTQRDKATAERDRLLSENKALREALESLAGDDSELFDGSEPAFLNARAALSLFQVKP